MTREEYIRKVSEEWLKLRFENYKYYQKKPYDNKLNKQDREAIYEATGQWAYNFLADAMKTAVQIHIKNHGDSKPPAFRYIMAVAGDLTHSRKKNNKGNVHDPAKQWKQ